MTNDNTTPGSTEDDAATGAAPSADGSTDGAAYDRAGDDAAGFDHAGFDVDRPEAATSDRDPAAPVDGAAVTSADTVAFSDDDLDALRYERSREYVAVDEGAAVPTDAAPADEVTAERVSDAEPQADANVAETDAAAPADDRDPRADVPAPTAASDPAATSNAVQYGLGPFSIREVALGGIWLVAFVVSFFPIVGSVGQGPSVWTAGIDWVLTIGLVTVAVFLLGLRRLSPDGIRRVGSLGIDQFASIAFSVSTIVWLNILWGAFVSVAGGSIFLATWVVWVEFVLMLAGVLLTVFAPFIAPFNEDFRHRPEHVAHRVARAARPVQPRPAPVATASAYAATSTTTTPAASTPASTSTFAEPVAAESSHTIAPAAHQAFWALAPVERDIVDETGAPIFRIGPTAWALVIEDRGDSFVVRHEDGRIGYLTDVTGVTRG